MIDDDLHYPSDPGFVKGSDTSKAAARKTISRRASDKQLVLELIHSRNGGTTDDELEVLLNKKHQTVSARRRDLFIDQLVYKRGYLPPDGDIVRIFYTRLEKHDLAGCVTLLSGEEAVIKKEVRKLNIVTQTRLTRGMCAAEVYYAV